MHPPLSSSPTLAPKCLSWLSRRQRSSSFPRPTCSHTHRCSRQHGGEQSGLVTLTFDLESGVRLTCDVAYLCVNFGLCSRLRPDVRDRQTSDAHHRLMPPPYGGGGIIKGLVLASEVDLVINTKHITGTTATIALPLLCWCFRVAPGSNWARKTPATGRGFLENLWITPANSV